MSKIFQFISVIAIVFILIVVIPTGSRSDVVISNNYPLSVNNASPCLKYQRNNSIGDFVNLSKSTFGTYGDNATIYVNSTWWSSIASDNSGNTFYVDTYGNLYENFSKQTSYRYLGSPYKSTNWIYSMVNSSSIVYTNFNNQGAEEFIVGSKNVLVNYIVLYLKGASGSSIDFSIGTTLWGSDVLSNITVNYNGNNWYNISIPTITLYGDKYYYLNVYQVNKNINWGSTNNPSASSKNYLQDYYYSGNKLKNDNSNPYVFTVGYYGKIPYEGPIVGIAVSNNTISEGGALVQELTEWGVVFELNVTNGNTISQGWFEFILPNSGYPSTTYSAINEIKSVNYYQEIFMYFATNGTVYYYLPDNGPENNNFYPLTYNKSPLPFVSACVYGYLSGNTIYVMPFGLLYNGSIYAYYESSGVWNWYYFGSTANGARAINIAPSDSTQYVSSNYVDSLYYLMVVLLNNNTYVYESNALNYNSFSGTFSAISIPNSQGTNEAVFNPWGNGWYILQTNGTIAHSSSWVNPSKWEFFRLPRYYYNYTDILNITDLCSKTFTVFANLMGYSGIYNMYYYNMTFYNNSNKNRIQFIFNGNFYYLEKIINLSSSNKIFIKINFYENKAYNATFNFLVYTYPQGNNNIIIAYQLKIIMIDHFSYILI